MGVYIKGMEIPKKCQYCPISHWNTLDIITGCELVDRYVSKTDKDFWDNDRPSWCPLIEVPEPHGDLIERDKLRAKEFIHDGDAYAVVMSRDIRNAPTIIPSSEEGE